LRHVGANFPTIQRSSSPIDHPCSCSTLIPLHPDI
jgi:hypothetical protein